MTDQNDDDMASEAAPGTTQAAGAARDKRALEIHEVEWDALAPHAARNALFEVSAALDLAEVARAIRDDDTAAVSAWLERGALGRPDDGSLAAFAEHRARFRFVIVQPWVVAQRLMD